MKIIGRKEIAGGKWLALDVIDYVDNHGIPRKWEAVARRGTGGAVLLIVRMKPSGRVILIRQFRPPVGECVIEFPAGLIDPGEVPAVTAVRELREETGYEGTVDRIYPPTYTSPGLTGEYLYTVLMTVDESAQKDVKTDFKDGEDIETILIEKEQLLPFVENEFRAGHRVDSKVLAYALPC